MKVNKKQLEALIKESVEEQISNLNEEELDELLGGLKGVAQGAGAGLKRAGQAVKGAAARAGSAVAGAARGVGGAVSGVAGQAASAVKGAYQHGEKTASLQKAQTELQKAIKLGVPQGELQPALQAIEDALDSPQVTLSESKQPQKTWRRKPKK
jgi:hypothetical protein